jgi:hypothetical protein
MDEVFGTRSWVKSSVIMVTTEVDDLARRGEGQRPAVRGSRQVSIR